MNKQLDISTTLSLPLDVVTQREAILAVSGAGKSNAARAMAEEFFAAKLPFVAIDPKGDWWGLRSGRDGTAKGGLDVVIFGGSHGDVPLERTGGAYLADLISKERLSSILDLSAFESKAAMKAFLYDFGRQLYRKNQDPLKIFADEADEYLPQKPQKDELKLLSVFEDIVRRGRSKGIGITLITQRSAVVSKNVLTQVETLYAMRTTGPQDVKVIESWMQYHGADRAMLATLATLADGEAWVWSPHYLKKMERFRFRLSHTFDSGATPTNVRSGSRRRPATLSDIDVSAIAAKMAETIERAAASDPREMQKKISQLSRALAAEEQRRIAAERSLRSGPASEEEILPWREWVGRLRAEEEIEQRRTQSAFLRVQDLEAYLDKLSGAAASLTERMRARPGPWAPPKTTAAELNELALSKMPGEAARSRIERPALVDSPEARLQGATVQRTNVLSKGASNGASNGVHRERGLEEVQALVVPHLARPRQNAAREEEGVVPLGEVKSGELRILGALAASGPLSKTRLAILTGYQHSAGGFATALHLLRGREWIFTSEREIALTPSGVVAAKPAPAPPAGEELVALWSNKLSGTARKLFEVVRAAKGPITAQEVVTAAGYKNAKAGNISDALRELRRYGLIEGTTKALELGEAREDFL